MAATQSVVKLCLRKQGTKTDPRTGEEPGKIFHEFPGVDLKGRNTAYAAIDTTPLFLLAANVLLKGMSKPAPENEVLSFLERLEEGVQRALAFVLAHISDEGLYFDAPATTTSSKDRSRGGHERFALPHTYWKDSPNLANSGAGKYPSYPVSYSVAHAYALLALDASLETLALFRTLSEAWEPTRGSLSSSGTVAGNARARTLVGDVQEAKARLIEGLPLLVAPSGLFVDFKDATGQSKGVSSDTLHVLAFLKPEYLQEAGIDVSGYEGLTSDLHTEVGIATTETFKDPSAARKAGLGDMYHQGTVWAIEQVLIFSGALRHRLFWIARVALRHVAALKRSAQDDEFWEFMRMSDDGKVWVGAGNHLQLWTVAAAHYFEHYLQTGEVSFLDGSLSTRAGAVAACTFHGVRPGVEERYCCLVEERARNQSCDDTFKCLDEMTVITFDQLNDDVCDCPDGSDEKGSPACSFADGCMFACEDGSGLAILPSVHRSSRRGDVAKGSRVDDHGKTRMKEGIWSTMRRVQMVIGLEGPFRLGVHYEFAPTEGDCSAASVRALHARPSIWARGPTPQLQFRVLESLPAGPSGWHVEQQHVGALCGGERHVHGPIKLRRVMGGETAGTLCDRRGAANAKLALHTQKIRLPVLLDGHIQRATCASGTTVPTPQGAADEPLTHGQSPSCSRTTNLTRARTRRDHTPATCPAYRLARSSSFRSWAAAIVGGAPPTSARATGDIGQTSSHGTTNPPAAHPRGTARAHLDEPQRPLGVQVALRMANARAGRHELYCTPAKRFAGAHGVLREARGTSDAVAPTGLAPRPSAVPGE
eukprot:scaffold4488_cov358-Prasinococcus_capsulatus_cf.AAC.7